MTKRLKAIAGKVDSQKIYPISEAVDLIKEVSSVKFDETFEVSIRLGIDAKKSDQVVRGAIVMPHGTGKSVRVAVFAEGAAAEEAKAAGADIVGYEDLAATVKKGEINFDLVIASPDSMRLVGQLGQILGPKGMMPNPKVGTVTKDLAAAVKNAKAGQVQFRVDKNGIVHAGVAKVSFDSSAIVENIKALIEEIKRLKPSSSKGIYLKKVAVSSTMGPGLAVDLSTLTS